MRIFTKFSLAVALLCSWTVGVMAQDEVIDFDASFYHSWNEVSATATDNGEAGGGLVLGEEVAIGGTIWGNLTGAVPYLCYANITDYTELRFEGTPGATIRLMCNRTVDEGPIFELKPTIGEDGKLTVKISDLKFLNGGTACDFVCLQSIKVPAAWAGGTMAATITSIKIVKPSDPLSIPKDNLKNAINAAKLQSSFGKTQKSFAALTDAIAAGEAALAAADATAESLAAATKAIEDAVKALALADGYTDLTADMFLKYASVEEPGEGAATGCAYELFKASDLPYGDGSVGELNWADLSAFEKFYIVTSGEVKPRLCLNRLVANGQQAATMEESKMLDINPNNDNTWSTEKYLTAEEGVYTLDVKKIVADYGFARLHSIKKQGWGAGVIVTGLYLYKTPKKPDEPATIDPAIDDADPAVVANKAALLTAITKGKNADLTNKTSASKKALADAIAEGEAQLASKNTTIAKIDAARRAILQAIDELENRPAPIAAIAVPEGWRSVITNGTLEGDDMSCFFSKTSGGAPEPSVAVDYEGVDDWKAIVINSTASTASQDWDDQFFIKATEKLAVGTKYRVEFDYRSDIEGAADTQTHNQPSEYIHWACINSVTFKPEWQHHKFEGTVSNDQTGNFQTVAFNMSKNRKDTKFVIDNIVFLVEDTTTGIKSVENNTGDVQYFDLQGRRVAQPAKGLYIKNGKMVMVK